MSNKQKGILIAGSILLFWTSACIGISGVEDVRSDQATIEANIDERAEATEQALAIARVEATATRAYFETVEARCASLTPEECANVGTHFYDIVRNPRPSTECNYNDWPASREPREITFQDNLAFVSNYGEDYSGHSRVAQNVFEWTNPADGVTHTITFSQEGYTETTDTSPCGHDIVNTISE